VVHRIRRREPDVARLPQRFIGLCVGTSEPRPCLRSSQRACAGPLASFVCLLWVLGEQLKEPVYAYLGMIGFSTAALIYGLIRRSALLNYSRNLRAAVLNFQKAALVNQTTTLCGVIGPPRSETITGPADWVAARHAARAVRKSSCNGMTRPLAFLAARLGNSRTVPMAPVGSVHSPREAGNLARSQACLSR
jgi:hypothetical protein